MKCFFFNHDWTKYGDPFVVYGAVWKQAKKCRKCGEVHVRRIGFIQASSLKLDTIEED